MCPFVLAQCAGQKTSCEKQSLHLQIDKIKQVVIKFTYSQWKLLQGRRLDYNEV